MKRDELKELGLTAEQIDGIMKIHGSDVESFKSQYSDYDELKAQNNELTKQVAKNEKDLKSLAKSSNDNEELQNTIKSLQDENKQIKSDFESKVSSIKRDNAINNVLNEHKARNAKAVKALLDMDSITFGDDGKLNGLDDQLSKVESDNAFLFDKGEETTYEPKGSDQGGNNNVDQLKALWGK